MKNITVSVDEDIHRLARIRAAELGTSLSALVRDYLAGVASGSADASSAPDRSPEAQRRRRSHELHDVLNDIATQTPGFRAADNLSRDALHHRDALR